MRSRLSIRLSVGCPFSLRVGGKVAASYLSTVSGTLVMKCTYTKERMFVNNRYTW